MPPGSAREARLVWARLVGDLSGRPVFFVTYGTVWGFRPQAEDLTVADFARRLYGYSGVAARMLERQADGTTLIRQNQRLRALPDPRASPGTSWRLALTKKPGRIAASGPRRYIGDRQNLALTIIPNWRPIGRYPS